MRPRPRRSSRKPSYVCLHLGLESEARPRRPMAMRLPVVAVVLCVLAGPVIADKDPNITGTFDVKYEEVANNCTTANTGISLQRGTLKVGKKGKTITVDVQRFELMSGSQAKGGKLKATS